MSSVVNKVEENIKPIIENLGYEVVEIEYAKKVNGYNLTIFIANEKGITLDDCEKVSKAIDTPLDELNPTNDVSYTLNVSSAGLDRPLKTDADFRRNLNKELEIKLFSPIDGKKVVFGNLVEFDENSITIENDKKIKIERKQIAKAVIAIHF